MNSEFGLMHLWAQGDIVTRIVFVILASMSVLSWCVIIIKGLGILRVQGQARKVPAIRPGHPGLGRLYSTIRGAVWHGLGHLSRAHEHWSVGAGQH